MLVIIQPVKPFVIGYNSYGMNHLKAQKLLYEANNWCSDCFNGIDLIVFSNSVCVGHWGGYCNAACYEFKGNYNKIIIGNMNSASQEDLLFYLKHELIHHIQYGFNSSRTGFSLDEERLANEYAS
jgi:hypothetical protein